MATRVGWVLSGTLVLVGACVLQAENVQGPTGEKGDPGTADTSDVDALKAEIAALKARLDAVEKQQAVTDPECPVGYTLDATETAFEVCKKGADEVVKVGTGGSAFWIDRYEASAVDPVTGGVIDFGSLTTLPPSGQWTTPPPPAIAMSRKGDNAMSSVTWFQANELCRAAGKRLPWGDEWLAAARGTFDPGSSDGTAGRCNTFGPGLRANGGAQTGDAEACVSQWGAEDMIGNIGEFTAEWYPGVGNATTAVPPWPSTYGDGKDVTNNITSTPYGVGPSGFQKVEGQPAVGIRGGCYQNGADAGIFALYLHVGPSLAEWRWGFRCMIPR